MQKSILLQKSIKWLIEEKYGGQVISKTKSDIARLKSGEPLDHVMGFVEFLDCKIFVNRNVLIPRVETEFWVSQAIEEINSGAFLNARRSLQVLDIFSGSGCIGVAVLKNIKKSCVTFADSELGAVGQIEVNCRDNKMPKEKYTITQSDVFSNILGTFDYIFANPPYIPMVKKNRVQKSVINYEPHIALFGGVNGIFYINRFLSEAKRFLNKKGNIFMEFDSIQRPAIDRILKKNAYKEWKFNKDQYGRWRWVVIQ